MTCHGFAVIPVSERMVMLKTGCGLWLLSMHADIPMYSEGPLQRPISRGSTSHPASLFGKVGSLTSSAAAKLFLAAAKLGRSQSCSWHRHMHFLYWGV